MVIRVISVIRGYFFTDGFWHDAFEGGTRYGSGNVPS
jgi:hypothetical protein